jgi:hypothetical protein
VELNVSFFAVVLAKAAPKPQDRNKEFNIANLDLGGYDYEETGCTVRHLP